jgi:hypothetical protein
MSVWVSMWINKWLKWVGEYRGQRVIVNSASGWAYGWMSGLIEWVNTRVTEWPLIQRLDEHVDEQSALSVCLGENMSEWVA